MLGRLQGAWRELDRDQRLAGLAALALLGTMFLPWYQKNVAIGNEGLDTGNLNAFSVFTFVEAAVLVVSLGVFVLLFKRGERRAFHLPGGDGTVIFAAGVWAALLLLWRVFDRPDVEGRGATVGITWGFFFAFLAAAALAAAGWRIRAAGRPEPPLLRADDADQPRTAATEVAPRRRRPVTPPAQSEQLTLDDAATEATHRLPPPGEAPTHRPAPPDEAPTRSEPPRDDAPGDEDDERLWSGPASPARGDDRPPPPPLRPGVFDQDAHPDKPLRPGETPRRAPD